MILGEHYAGFGLQTACEADVSGERDGGESTRRFAM
jgi:hypothetical protein